MSERAPFKEGLDRTAIEHLGRQLQAAWPALDGEAFVDSAVHGLEDLELKDRVRHTIRALRLHLPEAYGEALAIVLRVAASWQPLERADGLGSFGVWPLIDFVGEHGLEDFDASMEALRVMTGLWSAEFAIRPFLIDDAPRAVRHLERWVEDEDHHVRRLVSEGTRTRLPWGQRLPGLIADPSPVLPLLEALRSDESEYVRRSVANNLNDLAKDHAELVVDICSQWSAEDAATDRQRLVRRALRTLVKAGHPGALAVLGFDPQAAVSVRELRLDRQRVGLGETIAFSFELSSQSERRERLVVDYALHMTKKAGHRTAKVFKLKTLELEPGGRVVIEKKHNFKQVTVRSYHPGRYAVEVLVNGRSRAQEEFDFSTAGA